LVFPNRNRNRDPGFPVFGFPVPVPVPVPRFFLTPLENTPFSLLKTPSSTELEEEGNPSGFSPPPPFFCCNDHLSLLSLSLFERTPSYLEFSLDPSLDLFLDLPLTLRIQHYLWIALLRHPPTLERLLHPQNDRICVGLKTGFFLVRSAPLHQPKPVTCRSSTTTDAPAPRRSPQWALSITTRRSVVCTLLRVDLTRRRVVATRCPEFAIVPRSSCRILSFFHICCVIFCNFLLISCFAVCSYCLVFRCFGVDLIFLYFWFPFGSFFSIVTSHLNLHGLFGCLFRCSNGVYGLPMVVSIKVCAVARVFLRLLPHWVILWLHSQHSFSLLASVNYLVRVLASLFLQLMYCFYLLE
jgi:hypothetical protein